MEIHLKFMEIHWKSIKIHTEIRPTVLKNLSLEVGIMYCFAMGVVFGFHRLVQSDIFGRPSSEQQRIPLSLECFHSIG